MKFFRETFEFRNRIFGLTLIGHSCSILATETKNMAIANKHQPKNSRLVGLLWP